MGHGIDLTFVLRVKRGPVWEDEISQGGSRATVNVRITSSEQCSSQIKLS